MVAQKLLQVTSKFPQYNILIITFRCKECNKTLSLDTYASHQGVIYCKPHHKDLFKPKAVATDLTEEICKKNIDFASYSVDGDIVERHKKQERRMETIVRESKPVQLEGVVKCAPDAGKWDGLDKLDVASKFNMFEKAAEERESDKRHASDRWDSVFKLGQSYLSSPPIICTQRRNKNSARWRFFRLNVKRVNFGGKIAHSVVG